MSCRARKRRGKSHGKGDGPASNQVCLGGAAVRVMFRCRLAGADIRRRIEGVRPGPIRDCVQGVACARRARSCFCAIQHCRHVRKRHRRGAGLGAGGTLVPGGSQTRAKSTPNTKSDSSYETGTGVTQDLGEARKWYSALIADPRKDKGTLATKQLARQRLANMTDATQEIIAYDYGRFVIVRSQDADVRHRAAGRHHQRRVLEVRRRGGSHHQVGLQQADAHAGSHREAPSPMEIRLARTVRAQGFATITRCA